MKAPKKGKSQQQSNHLDQLRQRRRRLTFVTCEEDLAPRAGHQLEDLAAFHCKSAWGPDADRRNKILKSLLPARSFPLAE